MNKLVIYHAHCMDGFGAAYAAWTAFRGDAEYLAANYNDPPPDVTGKDVYLLDFSYKREIVADMLTKAASVKLIDHHITALNDLQGLGGLLFCNSKIEGSGAMLTWMYLNGEHVSPPWFFKYIQDRDLWRFEFTETRAISAYLNLVEKTFENWVALENCKDIHAIYTFGKLLLAKRERDVDAAIAKCSRSSPFGVPMVNITDGLTSEVGEKLSMLYPFAVSYFDTESHRIFSLRSNAKNHLYKDVSAIAKSYGGGGHKHAAGFAVSREHVLAKV
jgi:oligoribonuclease NrnB/cAMP/cGMP phosphodiesterase (DHH superfamily)